MRNSNRWNRGSGSDNERQTAGVGELRAVAERLLETGAHYLEQGREWLHAATRREQGRHDEAERRREGFRGSEEGFGPPPQGFGSGGEDPLGPWSSSDRRGASGGSSGSGNRAYSTRNTPYEGRTRAGYDYDDHRAREFDARADHLARQRPGSAMHDEGYRSPGRQDWMRDADYIPGSYGFGGEGRPQTGAASGRGGQGSARGGSDHSGHWDQAYRAQGQGGQRGRGPRGWSRSDERILEDVNERLCDDPIVDATEIEVRCEQGRIVLEGTVPTRWMKHRAEDIADAVPGAKEVDNRIRVAAEEPAPRGDFDTGSDQRRTSEDPLSQDSASKQQTRSVTATPATGAAASQGAAPDPQQPH